jgi:predicted transposase YbfD/YdcC
MDERPDTAITRFFGNLKDPRVECRLDHDLIDILTIALCAIICNADNWVDVAEFGRCKEAWFRTFLKLRNGIPSHDTFNRVFIALNPVAFGECFIAWVRHLCEDLAGEVVPIDGKTIRRAIRKADRKSAFHMVSAYASEAGLTLAQVAVDQKSNEITAIPELLKLLDIRGATVTIDAMGCQKDIAEQIVEQEGDYVLAVKDNQPALLEQVKRTMDEIVEHPAPHLKYDEDETTEKGHGRIERRKVYVAQAVGDADVLGQWTGLNQFVRVDRWRTLGDATSVETSYYISSHEIISAQRMARTIRSHWSIENSVHWTLDMAFDEDHSRLRTGNGAENMALLRKVGLNLLKNEKTSKRSINGKRLKAGWQNEYLFCVLKAGV